MKSTTSLLRGRRGLLALGALLCGLVLAALRRVGEPAQRRAEPRSARRRPWLPVSGRGGARAEPPSEPDRRRRGAAVLPYADDEDVHAAVRKGLRYLARSQSAGGAWIGDIGYKFNESYLVTDAAQAGRRRHLARADGVPLGRLPPRPRASTARSSSGAPTSSSPAWIPRADTSRPTTRACTRMRSPACSSPRSSG